MGVAIDDDIAARLERGEVTLFPNAAAAFFTAVLVGPTQGERFAIHDNGGELTRAIDCRLKAVANFHGDDGMFGVLQIQCAEAHDVKRRQVAKFHVGISPLSRRVDIHVVNLSAVHAVPSA
jgi:hypothetical protein